MYQVANNLSLSLTQHPQEIKRQLRNRPWLWGNDLNKYISNVSVPFEEVSGISCCAFCLQLWQVMRDDKAVLEVFTRIMAARWLFTLDYSFSARSRNSVWLLCQTHPHAKVRACPRQKLLS